MDMPQLKNCGDVAPVDQVCKVANKLRKSKNPLKKTMQSTDHELVSFSRRLIFVRLAETEMNKDFSARFYEIFVQHIKLPLSSVICSVMFTFIKTSTYKQTEV